MLTYFILWLLILAVSPLCVKNRSGVFFVAIALFTFSCFFGFRPIWLGTDTLEYSNIYAEWERATPSESNLEPVFSAFLSLFSLIGFSTSLVLFCFSLISSATYFYSYILVFRNHAIIFLYIFSSVEYWLFSINIMRAGLAEGFFLLATSLFAKKRTLLGHISMLAGLGFHYSLIFPYLVLVFSSLFNRFFKRFFWIILFIPLISIVLSFDIESVLHQIYNFPILSGRIKERIGLYLFDENRKSLVIGFSYFYITLFLLLFHLLRRRIHFKFQNDKVFSSFLEYAYSYTFIFVVFYPILSSFDVFARILMFLSLFHVFIVYSVISLLQKSQAYVATVILASIFFLKLITSGFNSGFLVDYFTPPSFNHAWQ